MRRWVCLTVSILLISFLLILLARLAGVDMEWELFGR